MNHASVFRILALMGLVLGAAMIVTGAIAAIVGEWPQLASFAFSGLITLTLAGMVLLMTGKPVRPARVRDGLAVVVLWSLGAPIAAAVPFVFGTAETSILVAIHEALSCLTTTGHSIVSIAPDSWPVSLLIWRGVLHCFGMVFSLVVAATVFAGLGFAGPGVHRSYLFTVPEGSFFGAILKVLRVVCVVCGAVIVLIFAGQVSVGVPADEALGNAVSVASTGLVDPNYANRPGYGWFASFVLFAGLFAATAGIAVIMDLVPSRIHRIAVDPELFLMIGLIVLISVLAIFAGLNLLPAIGWSMTALSTSGLPVWGSPDLSDAALPVTVLILPALVGGSALSTAGGIKLARIIILIRRAGQEFARLGYQHSVVALKFRNRHQKEKTVLGVWVYLIAYIGASTASFILLSIAGLDFHTALVSAIGAISNSGWMISSTSASSAVEHLVLMGTMLLGRLEVLALLPTLNARFWQK